MFTRPSSLGRKTALHFEGQSKTEAHHLRSCDINSMYNRLVGGDTTVLRTGGVYADITEMPIGLQSVLNAKIDGRRAYEALPALVRAHYPTAEQFYKACMNPANRAAFEDLGIFVKSAPVVQNPQTSDVKSASVPSPTQGEPVHTETT